VTRTSLPPKICLSLASSRDPFLIAEAHMSRRYLALREGQVVGESNGAESEVYIGNR
jgi:hypothetical protein